MSVKSGSQCKSLLVFPQGFLWVLKSIRHPQNSSGNGETDYRVMLWYQQSAGQRDLILIGHLHYQSIYVESAFEKDFSFSGDLSGDTAKNISLLVRLKDPVSNGMDYCAASVARQHTPTATQNKNQKLCGSYPRWFGMETSCQVFPRPPALEVDFCFILVSTNRVLYVLPMHIVCSSKLFQPMFCPQLQSNRPAHKTQ